MAGSAAVARDLLDLKADAENITEILGGVSIENLNDVDVDSIDFEELRRTGGRLNRKAGKVFNYLNPETVKNQTGKRGRPKSK